MFSKTTTWTFFRIIHLIFSIGFTKSDKRPYFHLKSTITAMPKSRQLSWRVTIVHNHSPKTTGNKEKNCKHSSFSLFYSQYDDLKRYVWNVVPLRFVFIYVSTKYFSFWFENYFLASVKLSFSPIFMSLMSLSQNNLSQWSAFSFVSNLTR